MKHLKRLGFTPHICNPPSWCITSLASGIAHAEPWHLPHETAAGKPLRTSLSNFSIYRTLLSGSNPKERPFDKIGNGVYI